MRISKAILGVSLAAGLFNAKSVSAHDGWLELSPSATEDETAYEVALMIGHGDERRSIDLTPLPNWVRSAVIVSLAEDYGGLETHEVERNVGLALGPNQSDTQVVAVTTFAFTNEMPADAFNDYLRQEGLIQAIQDRELRDTLNERGREIYHRTAKLIVVDGNPAESEIATVPLGLNLELIPHCYPVDRACRRSLPVRLLFNGRPLGGARVVLNDLASDDWPTAVSQTDSDGIARFEVPHDGDWMVSTIWSWPVENDGRGDYETIFSSLVLSRSRGAETAISQAPAEVGFAELTH